MKHFSDTKKLTFSAFMMALYVVVMYLTQGFAFGAYQIRIATSIYAFAYLYPFLALPLAFANLLSNLLFGGLGLLDIFGGFIVGLCTTSSMVFLRKHHANQLFIALPIIIFPGLGVPVYLSYLLHLPYSALAASLCIGQAVCGFFGAALVKAFSKTALKEGYSAI